MSFIYLASFLAPLGIAALLTSAAVGLVLRTGKGRLKSFAPTAQFRLVFAAANLPWVVSLVFFAGAIAGWKFYGVTELCEAREASGHFSGFLALSSAAILTAGLVRFVLLARTVRREMKFQKMMERIAVRRFGNFCIVPLKEPQAFVLGFFNPKIYLSVGLLKKFDKNSLKTIIAHEKSHVTRRDPLRRLVASLGLLIHLPQTASLINRQLSLIQELIADNTAAAKSESRLNLARLLVGFARMQNTASVSAYEFGSSNIEIRVRRLIDFESSASRISLAVFPAACAALLACALLFSKKLHLLYELILSFY